MGGCSFKMGAFTKHPYMEQNFETSWLNIFWGLFHLFVLDRLIGDAWRRGRLLGIVGSGQWGGRDKKKEKALKDGWENINISMDEQKNRISSFNIFDKIRHNLCLFWKTGWAQRDQNYCADPPIRDLTKMIIVNSLATFMVLLVSMEWKWWV